MAFRPSGPDVQEVLEKINRAYATPANLQMGITYNLYADWTPSQQVDNLTGTVKHKGSNLLMEYSGYELLENDVVTISVDHDDKVITVSNRVSGQSSGMDWVSQDISSYLKLASKIESLTGSGDIKGLRFSFAAGDQSRVDLYYNISSFFLDKIVIYYSENHYLADPETMPRPRMEILFAGHNTSTVIDDKTFAVTRYFVAGTSWRLNSTYSEYELVSLINP